MVMSCTDPRTLIQHLGTTYPEATQLVPNSVGALQFVFPDGLVINIYPRGTIHFQGQTSSIRAEVEAVVLIILNS